MEEDIQQKIETRLAELPRDVQEAIASSDYEDKIRSICKTQNLHVDQMQAVADETTLAMLGFIDMDSLVSGLQQQAHLSVEQAQTVAAAITHEVFMPIRESMKAWAAGKQSVVMPSSPKPVTPPPSAAAAPTPPTPVPVAITAPTPKPPVVPNLMAADAILSEKKVTPPVPAPGPAAPTAPAIPATNPVPKIDPAQPKDYKADPYREPVE